MESALVVGLIIMVGLAMGETARLSLCQPAVKTLYMSGYTADVIAHHGVLEQGVHFIQKPFSIQDLAIKVREAIEQK